MIKKILLALAALVAVFVVIVALQPADFRVARSARIAAPPGAVFAQVNDFHAWDAWSPWAKLDPAVKNTFDGARAGTGAIFAWSGNSDVGAGRMTITDSRPPELVRIKLEFLEPFEATSTTEFTFKPDGHQTVVAWSMSGEKNFLAKAFGLFMDCDTMIGGDFEKGLSSLKSVAEAAAKPGIAPVPAIATRGN